MSKSKRAVGRNKSLMKLSNEIRKTRESGKYRPTKTERQKINDESAQLKKLTEERKQLVKEILGDD